LLKPWGVEPQSFVDAAKRLAPGAELTERELVVGLALAEGKRDVTPFVLLPVKDAAKALEVLGADGGIVTFGPYEVSLEPVGGWLVATLTARPALDWSKEDNAAPTPAVLAVTVSDRGLDWLDAQLRDKPAPERAPPRWPTTLVEAMRRAPQFAPLATELADRARSVSVRFGDRTADAQADPLRMSIDIDLDLKQPYRESTFGSPAALPQIELGSSTIAELAVDHAPSPGAIEHGVALAMAALECRPDDVESAGYSELEYARYVEAIQRLAIGVHGVRQSLVEPAEGDPVASNEFAVVRFNDALDSLNELDAIAQRWNEVVRASDAGCPLLVERKPLAGPLAGEEGARFVTDALVAIGGPAARAGGPQTEGLAELLGKFYGGDGVFERHVVRVKDDLWVVSSLPASRTSALLQALRESGVTTESKPSTVTWDATGQMSLDRTLVWLQALDDLGHANTVGRRVPPPMAKSPPARFEYRSVPAAVGIDLTLPWATYEALAKHLTAERVPAGVAAP
jgi:hypothetical protein